MKPGDDRRVLQRRIGHIQERISSVIRVAVPGEGPICELARQVSELAEIVELILDTPFVPQSRTSAQFPPPSDPSAPRYAHPTREATIADPESLSEVSSVEVSYAQFGPDGRPRACTMTVVGTADAIARVRTYAANGIVRPPPGDALATALCCSYDGCVAPATYATLFEPTANVDTPPKVPMWMLICTEHYRDRRQIAGWSEWKFATVLEALADIARSVMPAVEADLAALASLDVSALTSAVNELRAYARAEGNNATRGHGLRLADDAENAIDRIRAKATRP